LNCARPPSQVKFSGAHFHAADDADDADDADADDDGAADEARGHKLLPPTRLGAARAAASCDLLLPAAAAASGGGCHALRRRDDRPRHQAAARETPSGACGGGSRCETATTTATMAAPAPANANVLYRGSKLGMALDEALAELINNNEITADLALRILASFDRAVAKALAEHAQSRLAIRVRATARCDAVGCSTLTCVVRRRPRAAPLQGHLRQYRNCDDVWTFWVRNAEVRVDNGPASVCDRLKIVACGARRDGTPGGSLSLHVPDPALPSPSGALVVWLTQAAQRRSHRIPQDPC